MAAARTSRLETWAGRPLILVRGVSRTTESGPRLAFWLLAALVGLLVLLPLGVLIRAALGPATALPSLTAPVVADNFVTVFASPTTYQLLSHTVLYAGGSILLGLAFGLVLAWLVERTDLPGRGLVFVALTTSLALPPMLTAMGWTFWLSPKIGLANLWLRGLTGSDATDGPLNGYSLGGMIWVTALAICPSVFLMLSALLRNMDASLEEAAKTHGANGAAAIRRVSLPLLLPGLLAVVMYFSVTLIQHFEIPLALGLPGRYYVLSTYVFLLTTPPDGVLKYGLAAAFASIALIFGLVLMVLYARFTRAGRAQTVTGKGFRPRRLELGPWKYPALGVVGLYLLLAVVAPLFLLLWDSLLPFYQPPSAESVKSLTVAAYARMLAAPRVWTAAWHSAALMAAAGTVVMLLSLLVAWMSLRSRVRGSRLLEGMAFLPLAIPQVVLALAILLLYNRTPLWGTLAILLVGETTTFLAFGSRTMVAALLQIDRELEQSALVHGGSWFQALRRVVVPLLLPALGNGWLWVATHSMRDFTFPLMLGTTSNVVLSSLIWSQWIASDQQGAAALAILLTVTLALIGTFGRAAMVSRAHV
jgi:iron(III) transport system permease protein